MRCRRSASQQKLTCAVVALRAQFGGRSDVPILDGDGEGEGDGEGADYFYGCDGSSDDGPSLLSRV